MGSVALSAGTLVIRADASARIGTGHIMRCFALAQAWQLEGGQIVFLSHCESNALCQRITDAGMEFIPIANPHPDSRDLQTTLETLRTRSAGARENQKSKIGNPIGLVLDGYHFDPVYQQAVRAAGYRLLVVDDMAHLPTYHADILLNQNLGAEKLKYNCDSDATLLLGSRYALLRQEFMAWRDWRREIPPMARKVLITLGGSDPENVTRKVIHALQMVQVDRLQTVVVVGGSNPYLEMLQSEVQRSRFTIRLEHDVVNMPELMAWADVAVSGGGSTCWELAFMGLPSVVLLLADNQAGVVEAMQAQGAMVSLDEFTTVAADEIADSVNLLLLDAARRSAMARFGRELVDGEGAARVVRLLSDRANIRLRMAREEDCRLVWEWANDPKVRTASFSSEPIPWDRHVQWFKSKLPDPRCLFYVATNGNNRPLGQIRFELDGDRATISVSLAPESRGKGYGTQLIARASMQAFSRGVRAVDAYIKPANVAAVRAFEKAGFVNLAVTRVGEHPAIHLVLEKHERYRNQSADN